MLLNVRTSNRTGLNIFDIFYKSRLAVPLLKRFGNTTEINVYHLSKLKIKTTLFVSKFCYLDFAYLTDDFQAVYFDGSIVVEWLQLELLFVQFKAMLAYPTILWSSSFASCILSLSLLSTTKIKP